MIEVLYSFLKDANNSISALSSNTFREKAENYLKKHIQMLLEPKHSTSEIFSQGGIVKIINYISNFGVLTYVDVIMASHGTEVEEKKIVVHFTKTDGKYIT